MEEVPGEPPSKPLSGAGAGVGLWGAHGFLGVVASDQVRCPVGVGLLLTCRSCALSGMSLRLPDPPRGGAATREGRRQADGRDPALGQRSAPGRLGSLVPSTRSAPATRPRPGARGPPQGGEEDKAVRGPGEGEQVVPWGTWA